MQMNVEVREERKRKPFMTDECLSLGRAPHGLLNRHSNCAQRTRSPRKKLRPRIGLLYQEVLGCVRWASLRPFRGEICFTGRETAVDALVVDIRGSHVELEML